MKKILILCLSVVLATSLCFTLLPDSKVSAATGYSYTQLEALGDKLENKVFTNKDKFYSDVMHTVSDVSTYKTIYIYFYNKDDEAVSYKAKAWQSNKSNEPMTLTKNLGYGEELDCEAWYVCKAEIQYWGAIDLHLKPVEGAEDFTLTVKDGKGSGSYYKGEEISIEANVAAGKDFDKWTGGTGGIIANAASPKTTFTLPADSPEDLVTVSATYKTIQNNDDKKGDDKKSDDKVILKKPSIKKIKVGKKKMTVSWNKVAASQGISKYKIQYREKGKSKWKSKTVVASKSSDVIKKLKKGKKYEVRLQTIRSSTKENSPWSKIKKSGKIK